MNTIALKLLSLAYECYLKTSGKDFRFTPSNSNDYIQTVNAVNYLEENGYILMLSNNVDADVIKLVEKGQITDETTFYFELTGKGLEYCVSILNIKLYLYYIFLRLGFYRGG